MDTCRDPLHAAAGDLLAALEEFIERERPKRCGCDICKRAIAAIAKARSINAPAPGEPREPAP